MRITVCSGQEVLATIQHEVNRTGIANASMTLIGAVELAEISTMRADDAATDVVTTYSEPLELSGMGEVVDGKAHIHVTLGRQNDVPVFGHLHRADVNSFFVHAYLSPA